MNEMNFKEIVPAKDALLNELENIKGGKGGLTLCLSGTIKEESQTENPDD